MFSHPMCTEMNLPWRGPPQWHHSSSAMHPVVCKIGLQSLAWCHWHCAGGTVQSADICRHMKSQHLPSGVWESWGAALQVESLLDLWLSLLSTWVFVLYMLIICWIEVPSLVTVANLDLHLARDHLWQGYRFGPAWLSSMRPSHVAGENVIKFHVPNRRRV